MFFTASWINSSETRWKESFKYLRLGSPSTDVLFRTYSSNSCTLSVFRQIERIMREFVSSLFHHPAFLSLHGKERRKTFHSSSREFFEHLTSTATSSVYSVFDSPSVCSFDCLHSSTGCSVSFLKIEMEPSSLRRLSLLPCPRDRA